MNLNLKDKSVLVLAGASGIGKGVATEFAREGSKVMIWDLSGEKLEIAQKEIYEETKKRPSIAVVDLTDGDSIKNGVEAAERENGPVFTLFNNTGGPRPGVFEIFSDEDWTAAFELTLLSYIRTIRAVLPGMKAIGGGRIINNTSSSIKQVLDNLILSNVFRKGIMGLSKTLARELAPYQILVNVIGPGKIGTGRVKQIDGIKAQKAGMTLEEFQKKNAGLIPLQRYGTPDEMGKLAVFLGSPFNTYVTGQNIMVDGGMTTAF